MHLPLKEYFGVILSKVLYIADILSIIRLETIPESVFSLQFIRLYCAYYPSSNCRYEQYISLVILDVVSFLMCRHDAYSKRQCL